jgi:hypothetical protein
MDKTSALYFVAATCLATLVAAPSDGRAAEARYAGATCGANPTITGNSASTNANCPVQDATAFPKASVNTLNVHFYNGVGYWYNGYHYGAGTVQARTWSEDPYSMSYCSGYFAVGYSPGAQVVSPERHCWSNTPTDYTGWFGFLEYQMYNYNGFTSDTMSFRGYYTSQ